MIGFWSDENVRKLLSGLSAGSFGRRTEHVVIGSYPFYEFFEPRINTIGIIGGQHGRDKFVSDFFEECGYETNVAGKGIYHKNIARRSDVVVINRAGREGTGNILKEIGECLGEEKLLVINSSFPNHVKRAFSGLEIASELLYMDTLVVKSVPVKDQPVLFIGDVDETPGGIQSEFIGIYEDRDANVCFVDFEEHAKYRGFFSQAPVLASTFYLTLARLLGMDMKKSSIYAGASERIFADIIQKTVGGDRRVRSRSLGRYAQENKDSIERALQETSAMTGLTVEGLVQALGEAAKSANDIGGATERIAELYPHMFGQPDSG